MRTLSLFMAILALWGSAVRAFTQEEMATMQACVAIEAQKPDSTRSGVTAVEFCAGVVAAGDY